MVSFPRHSKKQLYIIGNGFDLHHWGNTIPNTSYNSFAVFLKENNEDIYDLLCKSCSLPHDPSDEIWGDFEASLANFESEEVFEQVKDYINDEDPHKIGGAGWEAKKLIDNLTKNLKKSFNEFVRYDTNCNGAVSYPKSVDHLKLPLPQGALYLSFNYTDTLERFYKINPSKVCYIHGRTGETSEIMLGHGVNPNDYNDECTASYNPEYEYLNSTSGEEPWQTPYVDHYSMSEKLVRKEINEYWSQSFKDAESNIKKYSEFFNSCQEINSVIVMGHSLSEADLPYFKKIKQCVSANATWCISYFTDTDLNNHKTTLKYLNIEENYVHYFKMTECVNKE